MQKFTLNLTAGTAQPIPVSGKVLFVLSADQGNGLTIAFATGNAVGATLPGMGPGTRIAPAGGFTGISVTADEDGAASFVVTDGDIDVQISQTNATIANGDVQAIPVRTPAGHPLSVTIADGTPVNVTATNVGINNDAAHPVPVSLVSEPGAPVATLDTKAQTPATVAPVAVLANAKGAVLIAADAARRAVRFYCPQSATGPVAITPDNATTFDQAAIVLFPGDFWNETDAPGAAWYAATPAATASAINLQTVKA